MSPLKVSSLLLKHMRDCIELETRTQSNWEVVITVPASFAESSQRAVLAASHAGFEASRVKLLEEPLAAFYSALEVKIPFGRSCY